MTFIFSKLFWAIAAPGNLLLLLLVTGVLRLMLSGRRHGVGLVILATLGLLAIAVLPIGQWALMPLEARFPQPHLPQQIAGIIVLGGAVEPGISRAHGQVALGDAAERIVELMALARRYPEAKLVLSGGEAALYPNGDSEASDTRTLLIEQGIAEKRIVTEDHSRNTFENAVLSRDLVQPQSGETWMLVTSAAHMPRAVGCFRHIGWDVLPFPVDYRTEAHPRPGFALLERLAPLDVAVKEWVGLVAYRLLGRIDNVLPAP